ncbi:MAG: hypothetical protein IK081_07885 [Lachnospiraceae bacterium]|nr:hypothetical protein [Lachnospiraceae bacterium]
MLFRKSHRFLALMIACLLLSSCVGKTDLNKKSDKTNSVMQEKPVSVSEEELNEINEFMSYFMTFPVIWDFDQRDMSGAVDYFAQKWVWADVTDLEYDAEAKVFYANADDFAEKMGRYFVMSDNAFERIDEETQQGKIKICANNDLPWGFSFRIDMAEEREGAYFVHGYNAEITENPSRKDDELFIGSKADPFLEFNAVIVRDKSDGKLRLKELDGLEDGPGVKLNVSEISDADMEELKEFTEIFSQGPVLEQFNLNNLTGVFDFAAQVILQTNPEVVRETDDGRCVVQLSELISFMEQYFYLPKGFEKHLPKEGEGNDGYPCLAKNGVVFIKNENISGFELRPDSPVVQNDRHLRYGAYNVNAEKLRDELVAEGTASSAIETAVKEQYPFELVVIRAVRGTDGKLRLLYFMPYYL